jgi:hypothetical protein
MLEMDGSQPDIILATGFLLCCFEIVAQHETVSITLEPHGALVAKLELWKQQSNYKETPMFLRLKAWFQILHCRALHLGGRGILSPRVSTLLKSTHEGRLPCLYEAGKLTKDLNTALLEDGCDTLFEFYLELQRVSIGITGLNRHHRSRGLDEDETEVKQLAERIHEALDRLWTCRPSLLRVDRRTLMSRTSTGFGCTLERLVDIHSAAYFAEVIYLGRAYGAYPTATSEALEAMQHIHQIVDAMFPGLPLDPSFIWPLFMYAVEHPEPQQSKWAIHKLRDINCPLWHSALVADLAQGISETQFARGMRVDSRYFCLQRFGAPPPFI